MAFRFPI